MARYDACGEIECLKCAEVVSRTYRELRVKGYDDRDAFLSAVNVLELRHPGHDRYYYFRCAARLIGARCQQPPEK